jgi:hypothetical protein
MSSENMSKNESASVRLSAINVDLRNKMAKFDTKNEGELNVEDMMHAIVTLQKQSNNYIRLLYLLVPVMFILVASIFGTTLLAINLTKEMKTSSDGYLVGTSSNQVVSTSNAIKYGNFNEWLMSSEPEDLKRLEYMEFQNTVLPVESVFVTKNKTTIVFSQMYLVVDRNDNDMSFYLKDSQKNDSILIEMIDNLQNHLMTMKQSVKQQVIGNMNQAKFSFFELFGIGLKPEKPRPAASVKPTCSPSGICSNPPKTK